MNQSERNQNTREETFSLTVDQYGSMWLHAKMDRLPVAIELGGKEQAFQIMAELMAEEGFDCRPLAPDHDGEADNDDERRG